VILRLILLRLIRSLTPKKHLFPVDPTVDAFTEGMLTGWKKGKMLDQFLFSGTPRVSPFIRGKSF
jgi:hypothetical protein